MDGQAKPISSKTKNTTPGSSEKTPVKLKSILKPDSAKKSDAPKSSEKKEGRQDSTGSAKVMAPLEIKKEVLSDDDRTGSESDDAPDDQRLVIDESTDNLPKSKSASKTDAKRTSSDGNDGKKKTPHKADSNKKTSVKETPDGKKSKKAKPAIRISLTPKGLKKTTPRPENGLNHSPSGDAAPSTSTGTATAKEVKTEKSFWDMPFEKGWRREIVYRATFDPKKKALCDVYYFAPCGYKLRSMPEILNYLKERGVNDLFLSNFTFMKDPIYHPPQEVTRQAKQITCRATTTTATPKATTPKATTPKVKKTTPKASPAVPAPTPSPTPDPKPSPITPITPFGETEVLHTKRWRKRKALPPDFVHTDAALSQRSPRFISPPPPPPPPPPVAVPTTTTDVSTPVATPPVSTTKIVKPTPVTSKETPITTTTTTPVTTATTTTSTVDDSKLPPNSVLRRSGRSRGSGRQRYSPSSPEAKEEPQADGSRETNGLLIRTLRQIGREVRESSSTRKSVKAKYDPVKAEGRGRLVRRPVARNVKKGKPPWLKHIKTNGLKRVLKKGKPPRLRRLRRIRKTMSEGDLEMPQLSPMVSPRSRNQKVAMGDQLLSNGECDMPCMSSQGYDSEVSVESDHSFSKKKFVSCRPLFHPELDQQLYKVYLNRKMQDMQTSDPVLVQSAKEIFSALGFKTFVAPESFLEQWKERMNIKSLAPSQMDKASFVRAFDSLNEKHSYSNQDVAIISLCHFPPDNHLCSIYIAGCSSGAKLSAFVVFSNPQDVEGDLPFNVHIAGSGVHSLEVLQEWVNEVWGSPRKKRCRRLLILGKGALHSVEVATWCLRERRTDVLVAPTSLNLVWARDFEVKLTRMYQRHSAFSKHEATQQDLIGWIGDSWENVDEEDVILSHQACGVADKTATRGFSESDHNYVLPSVDVLSDCSSDEVNEDWVPDDLL